MTPRTWMLFIPALAILETTTSFPSAAQAKKQSAGTIVFIHAPDGGAPWPVEDVYSMDADGTNVKALTNDGHSYTPAWSPDGRRILFIHDSILGSRPPYREPEGFESYHPVELYMVNKDGTNRHLLRRLEPVIYSAAWSPDGKTLAITCITEALKNRPHSADEQMQDGLLAFSLEQPRGQWAVHVANSDGSNNMQLTEPPLMAGSPAWSPDGKMIAFDQFAAQRDQQIFVMGTDGSHRRQVTNDSDWSCNHPSWSADGRRLVFSCRSAWSPCGGISSVGTVLPECARRLFSVSLLDLHAKPIQLSERDGAAPAFAPIR